MAGAAARAARRPQPCRPPAGAPGVGAKPPRPRLGPPGVPVPGLGTPGLLADERIRRSLERMRRIREEMEDAERRNAAAYRARLASGHARGPRNQTSLPSRNLTRPITPNVLKGWLQRRAGDEAKEGLEPQEHFVFKARPMPVNSPPQIIRAGIHTIPKEFKLGNPELEKLRPDKCHNKEEMDNKGGHMIKARPIMEADPLPPIVHSKPTQPQPFRLTEKPKKREGFFATIVRVLGGGMFKARPIPRTIDEPFQIKPQRHPVTQIESFSLKTEERSKQRKLEEEQRKEREAKREEERQRQETEQKLREEEEIKALRRQMTFKARPLPSYLRHGEHH